MRVGLSFAPTGARIEANRDPFLALHGTGTPSVNSGLHSLNGRCKKQMCGPRSW